MTTQTIIKANQKNEKSEYHDDAYYRRQDKIEKEIDKRLAELRAENCKLFSILDKWAEKML